MTTGKIFTALLMAAAVVACSGRHGAATDHDHDHDHEHEHEQGHDDGHNHDEKLQLVAYGDGMELFAEASPFVVGQKAEILAHLTLLDDFKPLAGGAVTASLTVGAETATRRLEGPARPGIYPFELTPAAAGEGSIAFDISAEGGARRVVVERVTVYTDLHEAQHAAAEAAVTATNGAVFTKEQSWKVDFATGPVRREPFGAVIRTTARVVPSQGDERAVVARTGGIVSFAGAPLTEGASVAAGQRLLSVDGGATAEGNLAVRYAEAEAEYLRAKAEHDRKAELARDNTVSQNDLVRSEAELRAARAAYENLRDNFSAGRQEVASPIGGFVSRVAVRDGEWVEAGRTLAVVSQNRDLLLVADLQPRHMEGLRGFTSATVRHLSTGRTRTLEELGGRLLSYGRVTDGASPLVPVTFGVRNDGSMVAGGFVEMFISTKTEARALTVPVGAIVEEMGSHFVYVQLTPELFEKRAVTPGVTDGLRIEVRGAVEEGDRVVGRGAMLVKLAQASGALDAHAGHVH